MVKAKRTLISAYDTGGGNAVFPIARRLLKNSKHDVLCLVGGLSRGVFKREGVKFVDADSLGSDEIKKLVTSFRPEVFVAGTSVGQTFDKKLFPTLKKLRTKIIYVLDYWSRYAERFSARENDLKYLPDIFCVMDERARREAVAEGIPTSRVLVTGNPYFDFFKKGIKASMAEQNLILFISQPYEDKIEEFGYNEFTVLEGLLSAVGNFGGKMRVVIRPHPIEKAGKFDRYLRRGVSVDSSAEIQKLLSRAGLIVGMNSMVLFQAAVAGKKVISYQPNLKTRDYAVGDDLGLSFLVTDEEELLEVVGKYLKNKFPPRKKAREVIVRNATKNIIDIINK